MIIGIDPKNDYAFKHLFGRDATKPILIDVLDHVLNPAPSGRVRDLDLLNPFNPKEALDDKLSILDIKARDQTGRQFNVEMQMLAFPFYEKRILYYLCKLHQQQLHEGQEYVELKPTISISFLNYVLLPQVPDYHLRFRLLEEAHHFPLTGDLEFHILELPKFNKSAGELTSGLDIWLYFLRHAEMMDTDALPSSLRQPLVIRAMEELKVLTQSDLERERYEARRKAQMDQNTLLKVARMEGREEGREEGLEKGREEGLEKGREEGLEKGREEGLEKGREEGLEKGREEGLEKGRLIGAIQFCERMLRRPETPKDRLSALSLDDLARLAEDFQKEALQGG